MIGLVGQLAARRLQVAIPRRLPMSWAFPLIGLVSQLAARLLQVAPPGRYRRIGNVMATKLKDFHTTPHAKSFWNF